MNTEYKETKGEDVERLQLEYMHLDLSSFQSVKDFVEAYRTSGRQLHVLVCNAGVYKAKYGKLFSSILFYCKHCRSSMVDLKIFASFLNMLNVVCVINNDWNQRFQGIFCLFLLYHVVQEILAFSLTDNKRLE